MAKRIIPRWLLLGLALFTALVVGVLSTVTILKIQERHRLAAEIGSPFDEGRRIVAALDAFHLNHNEYPKALNDLIPKYINSIPFPNWGTKEWWYSVSKDGSGFELGVRKSKDWYAGVVFGKGGNNSKGGWTYDE